MIDVERSTPAPASLARGTSWTGADVQDRLQADFLSKCYLCEAPLRPLEFEVEHRVPRSVDASLIYAWTNLFPACDRCNGRRPAYPEGGLLSPGEGVEQRIDQRATPDTGTLPLRCEFEALDSSDIPALHCAAELAHLHDPARATTWRARVRTRDLLRAVHDRFIKDVWPKLQRYDDLCRRRTAGQLVATADIRALERELSDLLSRRAPYTKLVRSLATWMSDTSLEALFD